MDFDVLFPGRFMKAADLKGQEVTYTIASVGTEKVGGTVKALVTFEGKDKEMVLNRTNAEAVKAMFGRETEKWLGRRITLFSASVDAFGETKPAIRVRGSPEIDKPIRATITRGAGTKVKLINVNVVPTGKSNGKPATTPDVPPADPNELDKLCIRLTELGEMLGRDADDTKARIAKIKTVEQARGAVAKLEGELKAKDAANPPEPF